MRKWSEGTSESISAPTFTVRVSLTGKEIENRWILGKLHFEDRHDENRWLVRIRTDDMTDEGKVDADDISFTDSALEKVLNLIGSNP